jgi:hypothetical protein
VWENHIRLNPLLVDFVRTNGNTLWNGIALNGLTIQNDSSIPYVAACAVTGAITSLDINESTRIEFNSLYFDLWINLHYGTPTTAVLVHELGHALGIGTGWHTHFYADNDCLYQYPVLSGDGGLPAQPHTQRPLWLNGASCIDHTYSQAQTAYNAMVGSERSRIPVEEDGGTGTYGAHWEMNTRPAIAPNFELPPGDVEYPGVNDIMVGWISNKPVSNVSIKFLLDLGYETNTSSIRPQSIILEAEPADIQYRCGNGLVSLPQTTI